jgi:hypothetical protein
LLSKKGGAAVTVLVDDRISRGCEEALVALGAKVKRIPTWDRLPEPVSGHPDLLTAKLPDGSLLLTRSYYEKSRLFWDDLGHPLTLTEEELGSSYPADVLFDALGAGNTLYGKEGAVSKTLLACYPRFVSVRQGYARCSVALLTEKAAITADRGLSEVLKRDGIDVLTVRAGHIGLPGYGYGFLGGAGGRLREGVYVFFGDLLSHPDGEAILAFCKRQKISAVSLADEPLRDYGGLLVL